MRSLMQITAATPSKHRAFYLDPERMETLNLSANDARTETALSFSFQCRITFLYYF